MPMRSIRPDLILPPSYSTPTDYCSLLSIRV